MDEAKPQSHLTAGTLGRLALLFAPDVRAEAERLLAGEMPDLRDMPHLLERCNFAALKISGGTLEGLRHAIELANEDWRDLLMLAGFGGSTTAHLNWLTEEEWANPNGPFAPRDRRKTS